MNADTTRSGQRLGRVASAGLFPAALLLLAAAVLAVPLAGQTSAAAKPAGKPPEQQAKSFKPHAIFLPVIYYTPETRLALGAGGVLNYRLGLNKETTRPSSLWILFVYTLNSQIQASLRPEIYLPGNRYVVNATLKYELFPTRFYGVGNDVLPSAAETYTPESLIGRKVVIVANLAPRKLRGLESNGMIVAASFGEKGTPILCGFLEDVPVGAKLK